MRTERVLAHGHPGAPTPAEPSLLRDSPLAAALAGAEDKPPPRSSKAWMGLLAGGLVTATALVLILRPSADTWSARGGTSPSASLRLFCIPPSGDSLVEVVASFASHEESARRGLRDPNPDAVILRRQVAVSTAP